jgi:ankyrin repeat protein
MSLQLREMLHKAVDENDIELISSLLEKKTVIDNIGMDDIVCTFNYAIERDRLEILTLFKNYMNLRHYDFYRTAIEHDKPNVIDLFLSWSWYDRSSVDYAIDYYRFDILLRLLEHKEIVIWENIINNLIITCSLRNIDSNDIVKKVVNLLEVKRPHMVKGAGALSYALNAGNLELARFLRQHGYPFCSAIYGDCMKDISHLRFVYEELKVEDEEKLAIEYACQAGNIECFKYLVSKGFKAKKGDTSEALIAGRMDMVMFLHENGYEWDDEFDITDMDENVRQYCHDNEIPYRWECQDDCIRCAVHRNQILEDLWQMEEHEYNSLIQWLPKEMLEDSSSLALTGCEPYIRVRIYGTDTEDEDENGYEWEEDEEEDEEEY